MPTIAQTTRLERLTRQWEQERVDRTDQHGMHAHTLIMHRDCEHCRRLGLHFDPVGSLLRDVRRLAA